MKLSANTPCRGLTLVTIFTTVLAPAGFSHAADPGLDPVDFCYAPPEWQTAICLPDDQDKSLLDKSGELLYHYKNYNYAREEFRTRVGVEVVGGAVWQKQKLQSPRIPIVKTYR